MYVLKLVLKVLSFLDMHVFKTYIDIILEYNFSIYIYMTLFIYIIYP